VITVVARAYGAIENLEICEQPEPPAAPGHVRIAAESMGISFADGLLVRGLYHVKPPLPFIPGGSVSGVVSAVGADVSGFACGDRVAAVSDTLGGGWCTSPEFRQHCVAKLPDGLDYITATGMLESWGTMNFAFTRRVRLHPGDKVLVLGAGGGIGLAATDLAKATGAVVIAAASSARKLAAAAAAGADHLVDYTQGELRAQVLAIWPDGADYVVDPVGGAQALAAIKLLAERGSYLIVGFASGDIPRLGANRFLISNRSAIGIDWGEEARVAGDGLRGQLAEVFAAYTAGRLHPPRPLVFGLDEVVAALKLAESRQVPGKIVLVPPGRAADDPAASRSAG
jgi:NADPH:quinone reductase